MNKEWIHKRVTIECSASYGLHSHCIFLSVHCIIPSKNVLVRLIEPPATFPVCLEVYGEKPAMGKDNDNDSYIMHLFSLAQIILPSHLDHKGNRGWFWLFFSLTIADHCVRRLRRNISLLPISSLSFFVLPLSVSLSFPSPALGASGSPGWSYGELQRQKLEDERREIKLKGTVGVVRGNLKCIWFLRALWTLSLQ